MRRCGLIGILLIVVFLLPITSPFVGTDIVPNELATPSPYDGGSAVSQNGVLNSGTGTPLPVSLSGVVSNVGEGTMQITSASPGVSSVTLTNGWTGSNLTAQLESLSMVAQDVLSNGNFNNYHNEQFLVTSDSTKNDDVVIVPNGWTIIKHVTSTSEDPHPMYGIYTGSGYTGGYSSTYGIRLRAIWSSSFVHNPTDEIYLRQMVTTPWRDVYSATVTFKYYVESSSSLLDQVHLFVKLAGSTTKFHVFLSGSTTDTWLTTSVTIPASSMQDLSNHVLPFDIGLASDLTGTQAALAGRVRIDDVKVDFTVRPFPEQVNLKANGTIVQGYTSGSIYPYVPDNANRDCYDAPSSGIDFDGYGNDGGLGVGIYDSSGYYSASKFQAGLQFPIDIPQGAIVTSAYLEVEAFPGSSPPLEGMRVYVADADNLAAFTSGLPQLEDRYTWLSTSLDWTLRSWITTPQTRYRSPEMGSLVQSIISRSGWSSGNYLGIMLDHMYSSYYQYWNDVKGTAGFDNNNRARLFVEYIVPLDEDVVTLYNYQKTITIDHTKVAATLTDFPVLIDLVDTDLKSHVLAGGNDIAFTLNGLPLDHEI
jgi:hypothetical protein